MIIDVHAHFWDEEGYLEKFIAECKRLRIDKVCLSACGPLYNQVDNNRVKEACLKHPDLIIGFGHVRLGNDRANIVDELYEQGFRGLKVINPSRNYDDKEFYPIYEQAQVHNMPILFHTGLVVRTGRDKDHDISSARMRPIYLDTVARAFPKLNLIGAHLGVPWHDEACAVARLNPNVYFDLTGSPHGGWRSITTPDDFKKLFYWEGAFEKILFGTDVRIEHLERAFKIYEEMLNPLNLPKDTLCKIYGGTAAQILGLSGG